MSRTTIEAEVTTALKAMPSYVKEKKRRYLRKKKTADKAFGKIIKQIEQSLR